MPVTAAALNRELFSDLPLLSKKPVFLLSFGVFRLRCAAVAIKGISMWSTLT
jgi:hypothetical protein